MMELTSLEFAKHFKNIIQKTGEERFCFVLGSGASIQSGIPTGGQLATRWLKELREDFWSPQHEEWLKTNGINTERAGDNYSEIFKKRFEVHPQEGYDELNRLMEKITPSYGYSVLSQLLETKNNVVITTNFDSLIEEALFTFSTKRPLVCGHEYLAPFAKISDSRPLIIKIHRDRQLNPLNSPEQLEKIKDEWVSVLNNVFTQCIPVFIGYGGNDGSLMGYLDSIRSFSNFFWCDLSKDYLKQEVLSLIERHNGKFVRVDGFDELMFDLFSVLSYLPLGDALIESANKRAGDYANAIKKIQEAKSKSTIHEDKTNAQELTKKIKDSSSWLSYYYKSESEADIATKRQIIEEGLKNHPNIAGMICCYADFLQFDAQDYINAEIYYRKALKLDPDYAAGLGNYASLLKDIKKEYDQAEIYYIKSLTLDPDQAVTNCNYANFLTDIKKDHVLAEKHYRKALKLDASNAFNNGNYATFLLDIKNDSGRAEKYYLKALELEPNNENFNGNYAGMLLSTNRRKEAMPYFYKAQKFCTRQDLEIELHFYQFAHNLEDFKTANNKIRELIKNGYRSPSWNFQPNIERAKLDNHPDIPTLQLYADIITKDIPLPPDF